MEPPDSVLNSRHYNRETYKTVKCTSFSETNKCRYGRNCLFAHGPQELRLRTRLPPSSPPQICLPVAMPMASLQAPYAIMPPLPPVPPPPHVYEPLPSKPLPPKPQPSPTLLQMVHPPLSDWSSLVKTIQELHKSIMPKKDQGAKKAPWLFEDSCLVCLDNIPTHAFMPCKHVVVCQGCASLYDQVKQKDCYKCREPADLVPFVTILCASI